MTQSILGGTRFLDQMKTIPVWIRSFHHDPGSRFWESSSLTSDLNGSENQNQFNEVHHVPPSSAFEHDEVTGLIRTSVRFVSENKNESRLLEHQSPEEARFSPRQQVWSSETKTQQAGSSEGDQMSGSVLTRSDIISDVVYTKYTPELWD